MKKNIFHKISATAIVLAVLTVWVGVVSSCERVDPEEFNPQKGKEAGANVTLRFTPYGMASFSDATRADITRAASPLSDQLQRLSVTIFKPDGTKAKSITQMAGDKGFGEVSVSLTEGTYKVVAIAHNGEGNATLTSTEKVTFASNKVTDTFSYCGTLTVGSEAVAQELTMQRVVAMVRLTLTEALPENVTRIKFYYTGGSSTLNPTTGYGCVNSKQTEYRYTTDEQGQPVLTYELYTMPHERNDQLKITIAAMGEDGSELQETTFENVPVTLNKITTWTGSFFSGGSFGGGTTGQGGFTLSLDTSWDGTISYSF